MSKRNEHRVVRPSGPLGPWRLSLSIVAAAVFTGMPLSRAATTGVGLDMALVRSLVVAFFTWIALSMVNRVLAEATDPMVANPTTRHDSIPAESDA